MKLAIKEFYNPNYKPSYKLVKLLNRQFVLQNVRTGKYWSGNLYQKGKYCFYDENKYYYENDDIIFAYRHSLEQIKHLCKKNKIQVINLEKFKETPEWIFDFLICAVTITAITISTCSIILNLL